MKTRLGGALTVLAATVCGGAFAQTAIYPVSGNWTYENASGKGPAESCGKRNMQFDGNLRYDTGSGAPEYKNISARKSGAGTWTVVDEFFTGMIRGRVNYTLRTIDPDHIQLHFTNGNTTTLLRRCG